MCSNVFFFFFSSLIFKNNFYGFVGVFKTSGANWLLSAHSLDVLLIEYVLLSLHLLTYFCPESFLVCRIFVLSAVLVKANLIGGNR